MANLDFFNDDGITICTCDDRGYKLQPGDIFSAQIRTDMFWVKPEYWEWLGHSGYLIGEAPIRDFDCVCFDPAFNYWIERALRNEEPMDVTLGVTWQT